MKRHDSPEGLFYLGGDMETRTVPIDSVRPYPGNAKQHPDWQVGQIKESIRRFGNNDPIAVDADGVIIEGHGRWLALKELGYSDIETITLDHLDDTQKRAYMLAHNKLTMNTGFDLDTLDVELDALGGMGIDMDDFGFHQLDLDLDDVYEDSGGTPEREPRKIVCPHCGEEIEV
jgi:ParB-like chromosome segregation protein Spo0J